MHIVQLIQFIGLVIFVLMVFVFSSWRLRYREADIYNKLSQNESRYLGVFLEKQWFIQYCVQDDMKQNNMIASIC